MFYVADGRIYGTEYDEKLKGYPEYRVTVGGQIAAVGKAAAKKPKNRQVCELAEVLAQISARSESDHSAKVV